MLVYHAPGSINFSSFISIAFLIQQLIVQNQNHCFQLYLAIILWFSLVYKLIKFLMTNDVLLYVIMKTKSLILEFIMVILNLLPCRLRLVH